jgi:hypothetical protein
LKEILTDDTTLLSAGNNLLKLAEDFENDLKKVPQVLTNNRPL